MFDRDHVIPKAFGTFEPDNMVIQCVCRQCNGGLGRTIEQKMARDSVEAIERIKKGLKKPAEWKARGPNGSVRVEVTQEGPTKGVAGYYGTSPDGTSLTVDIAPTIGISKTEDEPSNGSRLTSSQPSLRCRLGALRKVTPFTSLTGACQEMRRPNFSKLGVMSSTASLNVGHPRNRLPFTYMRKSEIRSFGPPAKLR